MSNDTLQTTDSTTIERELRDLWIQMSGKSQPGEEQAVTRACVHNLAIYAPGEGSEEQLSRLLTELAVSQPGRVILMLPNPAANTNLMTAWVSAQCHLTSGQRQQVCSEQIMVRAEGAEVENAASLVIPLLVPDLPVYFWWRDDLTTEWMHFQELVEHSDRVIVDSGRFQQPVETLRRLLQIVKENQGTTAFSDLNWNRLTPLRQMTAGFFDHAAARAVMPSITQVNIEAYSPTGFSIQAFLFSAWIAARMKWRPVSAGSNVLLLDSPAGRVRISIFVRPPAPGFPRGIASVTMRSEEPAAGFHISYDADTRLLRASAELPGCRLADKTSQAELSTEEECVACELDILGHDRIYEETLKIAEYLL